MVRVYFQIHTSGESLYYIIKLTKKFDASIQSYYHSRHRIPVVGECLSWPDTIQARPMGNSSINNELGTSQFFFCFTIIYQKK